MDTEFEEWLKTQANKDGAYAIDTRIGWDAGVMCVMKIWQESLKAT